MLKLLEQTFDTRKPFYGLAAYIKYAAASGIFGTRDPQVLEKFRLKIKLCLENTDLRLEGLLCLKALVLNCENKLVEQNGFFWLSCCSQILSGPDPACSKKLACHITKTLASKLHLFPDLRSNVAEKLLPTFIQSVVDTAAEDQWFEAATGCLEALMKELPQNCYKYKQEIEKFLTAHLDTLPFEESEPLAACFSLLPSVNDRATNPVVYAKEWSELVKKLLGTLETILNRLFNGYEGEIDSRLDLPEEPENSVSVLSCTKRFQAVSRCLVVLFGYPKHPVTIPVEMTLKVINKALRISVPSMAAADDSNCLTLLPSVQCSALLILESLMLNCQDYMIPIEARIGTVIFSVLSSTKQSHNFQETSSSFLRYTALKVLRVWFEKLRPESVNSVCENFFQEIIGDISPIVNATSPVLQSLCQFNGPRKNMTKVSESVRSLSSVDYAVCTEALKVLSSICSSGSVPSKFAQAVQSSIVRIIMCIQRRSSFPPPYDNSICRQEVYRVLLSLVVSNTCLLPVALSVFLTAEKDSNLEVSSFSVLASRVCSSLISSERTVVSEVQSDTGRSSPDAPASQTVLQQNPTVNSCPVTPFFQPPASHSPPVPCTSAAAAVWNDRLPEKFVGNHIPEEHVKGSVKQEARKRHSMSDEKPKDDDDEIEEIGGTYGEEDDYEGGSYHGEEEEEDEEDDQMDEEEGDEDEEEGEGEDEEEPQDIDDDDEEEEEMLVTRRKLPRRNEDEFEIYEEDHERFNELEHSNVNRYSNTKNSESLERDELLAYNQDYGGRKRASGPAGDSMNLVENGLSDSSASEQDVKTLPGSCKRRKVETSHSPQYSQGVVNPETRRIPECSRNLSEELDVNDMMKDFKPCSPDH